MPIIKAALEACQGYANCVVGADDYFAALYTDDGQRLSGAAIVNWPHALIECRRALQVGSSLADVRANVEAQLTAPRHTAVTPS